MKAVLKNLAIFTTRKLLWWSLFLKKLQTLRVYNIIKKKLQHRCLPVNMPKLLRTSILKIICKRLLLALEVLCIRNFLILAMGMLHLAYEKTLCGSSLSIFLTAIAFWPVKYLFRILCSVFIAQISHYGKFTPLHKSIAIALQLTNQIKWNFPCNHAVSGLFS